MWLHAWRCLEIRGAARTRPPGGINWPLAAAQGARRNHLRLLYSVNGRKGKKLARSCVCSSGRVGYPRGASAAQGTVLGLLKVSIVLVLGVGDVHDGHQSLLGAKAALQPVTIHLGDDLQNIPFVEAQLSCLSGNVMAKSFHLTAGRRKAGLAHLRTLTPPRDHHRHGGERKTLPASHPSQAPSCPPAPHHLQTAELWCRDAQAASLPQTIPWSTTTKGIRQTATGKSCANLSLRHPSTCRIVHLVSLTR